jgi:hypothetical protein
MKVSSKLTAGAFYLRFAGRMCTGILGLRSRAAVVCWRENDVCSMLPTYPAGMLLHRQAHRSGEHQQGQPSAENPVSKWAFHFTAKIQRKPQECRYKQV